jgi:hypothetical protein
MGARNVETPEEEIEEDIAAARRDLSAMRAVIATPTS